MIRILYVHHGKGIGGAPLSLLYLIRGLDRSKYFPTVLCLYDSEAVGLFRAEGIETHVARGMHDFSHTNVLWYSVWQFPKLLLRLSHVPRTIERARKYLSKNEFDIVHLNTSTLFAFAIAAKRLGKKVVWHIREPLHTGYFGLRRRLIQSAIRDHADVVIPICRYDAEQLIPSENIHVVYNFIDFARFDFAKRNAALKTELNISPDQKIVLMLGGVNPIKGTREFVEAAARIATTDHSVVFLIAGEIPVASLRNVMNGKRSYLRSIQSRISSSARPEAIRFIGVRKDIPDLLSISDLLCFPSTVAHFARPIIEASAMKVAVVASDIGGPRELVIHGRTGLLVRPGSIDALASAIESLLADEPIRRSMGEEGCLLARENFSAEKNIAAIVRLYESLHSSA